MEKLLNTLIEKFFDYCDKHYVPLKKFLENIAEYLELLKECWNDEKFQKSFDDFIKHINEITLGDFLFLTEIKYGYSLENIKKTALTIFEEETIKNFLIDDVLKNRLHLLEEARQKNILYSKFKKLEKNMEDKKETDKIFWYFNKKYGRDFICILLKNNKTVYDFNFGFGYNKEDLKEFFNFLLEQNKVFSYPNYLKDLCYKYNKNVNDIIKFVKYTAKISDYESELVSEKIIKKMKYDEENAKIVSLYINNGLIYNLYEQLSKNFDFDNLEFQTFKIFDEYVDYKLKCHNESSKNTEKIVLSCPHFLKNAYYKKISQLKRRIILHQQQLKTTHYLLIIKKFY